MFFTHLKLLGLLLTILGVLGFIPIGKISLSRPYVILKYLIYTLQ